MASRSTPAACRFGEELLGVLDVGVDGLGDSPVVGKGVEGLVTHGADDVGPDQLSCGADDGIRTRDPHLGKVMPTSAGDRWNRWSRESRALQSAGDRWNRWSPLHWSSRRSSRTRAGRLLTGISYPAQRVHPPRAREPCSEP